MIAPAWYRGLCFLLPLAATGLLLISSRRTRLHTGGAILAFVWNVPAVYFLNQAAMHLGWWSYGATASTFLGVPVDLWLAEAVLWGPLPLLLMPRLPLPLVLAAFAAIDIFAAAWGEPVVALDSGWMLGKAVGIAYCLLPAQAVGRWTREDRHPHRRATLQLVTVSQIVLLMTTFALAKTGDSWASLKDNPWWLHLLAFPLLAGGVVLGYASVQEFVIQGRGGTPVPWDPPRRFVVSGPYAYVANPMHLSFCILFAGLGLWLKSPAVALLGLWSFVHGHVFILWDRAAELKTRVGSGILSEYKRHVRCWILNWRPGVHPSAIVRIGGNGLLSGLARGLAGLRPARLAMETPGEGEKGLHYRFADGTFERHGVVALCRMTDHISLPLAWLGWGARLPGVRHAAEWLLAGMDRLLERKGGSGGLRPPDRKAG